MAVAQRREGPRDLGRGRRPGLQHPVPGPRGAPPGGGRSDHDRDGSWGRRQRLRRRRNGWRWRARSLWAEPETAWWRSLREDRRRQVVTDGRGWSTSPREPQRAAARASAAARIGPRTGPLCDVRDDRRTVRRDAESLPPLTYRPRRREG